MPVTFHTKLSPHYEGLAIISNIVNEKSPRKTYEKFVKAGKLAEADYILGDMLAAYEHAEANFDVSDTRIIELFKFWDNDIYSNVSFATSMTLPYIFNGISQMLQDFSSKDETAQKELKAKTLLSHSEESGEYPTALDAVIKKIDSMQVSSDLKFKIIKIYHTYYENLCFLSDVLNDVSEIITEKLKPLQTKATEIMLDLEKKSNGSMEYISKQIDVRLNFRPETDINVFPAELFLGVVFHDLSCVIQGKIVCIWGCELMQVLQVLREIEKKSDQSIESLRALTEKTKFEILSALLKKPLYGTELAQMLGLTGATVSHHVNELLRRNLVSANPEQNKVYYSINNTHIKELFQEMTKYFKG